MAATTVNTKKKKRTGNMPVSNVSKILLHDNQLENLVLEKSLGRIEKDQRRSQRLLEMQKQTFIIKQACKEQELRDMGIPHVPFLPALVMKQTEPDVNVRRPIAKPKKSASFLAKELEKTSLLPNGSGSVNGDLNGVNGERYTHFHGISWLPSNESEMTAREKEIIRKLNDMEASTKCVDDPRFVELEKCLVRKEKQLWEILGEEEPTEDTDVADRKVTEFLSRENTLKTSANGVI